MRFSFLQGVAITGAAFSMLLLIFPLRVTGPAPVTPGEPDTAAAVPDITLGDHDGGGPGADEAPHPISVPALAEKEYGGDNLTLVSVLDDNPVYTRYRISYTGSNLTLSGIMNIPKGDPPEGGYPLAVLNHGYIDPAVYTNGRGLKREQDFLARHGFAVIHPDYRNHAFSDDMKDHEIWLRLGYVEDAINAVYAVRSSELPETDVIDTERLVMLGHSMGGGVTLGVLTARPDLVDAAVLFAPVSGKYEENHNRWVVPRPSEASRIIQEHGTFEENPEFYANASPETFYRRITAPVMNHHGTLDDDVPVSWSDDLEQHLLDAGVDVTYHVYPGEPHEFVGAWPLVMNRTLTFFLEHVPEGM